MVTKLVIFFLHQHKCPATGPRSAGQRGAQSRVKAMTTRDRRCWSRIRNAPCSTPRDGLAAVIAGHGHDAFPDIHVTSHREPIDRVTLAQSIRRQRYRFIEGRQS